MRLFFARPPLCGSRQKNTSTIAGIITIAAAQKVEPTPSAGIRRLTARMPATANHSEPLLRIVP